jgi:hypothetical protein
MAIPNADTYYLYGREYNVIIDDLELWTVPREAE